MERDSQMKAIPQGSRCLSERSLMRRRRLDEPTPSPEPPVRSRLVQLSKETERETSVGDTRPTHT